MSETSLPGFDLDKFFRDIAGLFGLQGDFFADLLTQRDDWSFVIRCHVLLEAAVCALISTHLGKPDLEEVLAEHIEMSDRIRLLKALGLTSEHERKMMRSLGELRNRLVHNITRTNFTFAEHLKDKNRRQQFAEVYGLQWPDLIEHGGRQLSRTEFVATIPRFAVWTSVLSIATKTLQATLEAKANEKERLLGKALLDAWTDDSASETEPTDNAPNPHG
jgi:hypothetical protein